MRSYRRRIGTAVPPIGTGPIAGPTDPIGLTVELYLGAMGWTDISTYVYYRDRVRISRGRPNESSRVQPQTCSLTLDNRDGRFSPRNPNGPWYQLIGRNTPLRVSRMQNGVRRFRFVGEVPSWPVTWDISGRDVYVPIQAAGMLRRLQQGTTPLQSAMRRGVPKDPLIAAYWPCEDGQQSTSLAAAVGSASMTVSGKLNPATYSGFLGSSPIPTLGTDRWSGPVQSSLTGTSGRASFFVYIPAGTITAGSRIASIAMVGVWRTDVFYQAAGGISVQVFDTTGASVYNSGTLTLGSGLDGFTTRITVNWDAHVGGGTDFSWGVLTVGAGGAIGVGPTTLTQTISGVTAVGIAPDGTMSGAAVGHIWVQGTSTELISGGLFSWVNAYNTELPITRFSRLPAEQGLNAVVVAPGESGTDGVGMGYQLPDTLVNLLQQIADSDSTLLYEAADQLALVCRSRLSLYNQGTTYNNTRPGLTLDYALHELSGPPGAVDDDAYTRNDITAQRISGSQAQAIDTDPLDPLSSLPFPQGVGDYATTYSLSVGRDSDLPDHAGWRLHLGTVNEPRYPTIPLNLRHASFGAGVDLLNSALTLDIGDLVVVNNPPAGRGAPGQIRLILQGYSEVLGIYEHDMVLNCSPESPYRVAMLEDPVLGRADTDGSTLAAPLSGILNPNGFFAAAGASDWATTSCSLAVVGTSGSGAPLPPGGPTAYGALLTANGGSSMMAEESTGTFPAAPTQTYYASALAYYPSAAHTAQIGIGWLDSNGALISRTTSFTAVSANTWTALSGSFTAPAGAASGYPLVGLGGTPSNGDTVYFVNIVAWQGAITVATTGIQPQSPLWTTTGADFPFDVIVGGERMTVTAVSGASSPQAFTAARCVNSVAKPQSAGTDVRLYQPMILGI